MESIHNISLIYRRKYREYSIGQYISHCIWKNNAISMRQNISKCIRQNISKCIEQYIAQCRGKLRGKSWTINRPNFSTRYRIKYRIKITQLWGKISRVVRSVRATSHTSSGDYELPFFSTSLICWALK